MIPQNLKPGQYHYSRRGTGYAVLQLEFRDGANASSKVINRCPTKEAAKEMVYRLNGWS